MTATGLHLPANAQEKSQEGDVIAVGPGHFSEELGINVPMTIAVGDRVLFTKYGGTEVTRGGEEFLILNARDVLAVIEA